MRATDSIWFRLLFIVRLCVLALAFLCIGSFGTLTLMQAQNSKEQTAAQNALQDERIAVNQTAIAKLQEQIAALKDRVATVEGIGFGASSVLGFVLAIQTMLQVKAQRKL